MDVRSIATGCKINLFLRVTGCRSDGYHTLETLFLPLSAPSDMLALDVGAQPGIVLRTEGEVPAGPENLVYRAAELYASASGISPSWAFDLEKHVPVAAGLGGGSADAAGALLLLERHFRKLGDEHLRKLALKLGADVPFFLDPAPALARGVGEELSRLDEALPPFHLVLANPGFPVSAAWAYRHLPERPESSGTVEGLLAALREGDRDGIGRNIRNDLGWALMRKFPLLTVLRESLTGCGAFAVEVSGSGPTLFALFPDRAAATQAAAELSAEYPMFGFFALEA